MLIQGCPTALIAEVHGTGVEMIENYYGHPDAHKEKLAEFWARAKATGSKG
jgi:hypothetical protein